MNNADATHLGIRLEAAFSERLQNQEYSRAIVAAKELYQVVASCESLGNNEELVRGVFSQPDGMFLALGFTRSKTFKTRTGAARWLARGAR